MKKLLIILTIGLLAFGTSLSLEPLRVSVYAPQYETGPGTVSVTVELINTVTNNAVFTSDARVGLNSDDSGILTFQIGLNSAAEIAAWDAISSADGQNPTYVLRVLEGTTVLNQTSITHQIINQSSTSVFVNGNLLPPSVNSTVGEDGNRFKDIYVQENSVHIGIASGEATNEEIEYSYNPAAAGSGDGYGQIVVDGVNVMNVTTGNLDLLQNDIVDVDNLDNSTATLAINNLNNQPITLGGAFSTVQNANQIGDNSSDATKLTITGQNTPAVPGPYVFELVVEGDAQVQGFLEINGLSLLGDLDMNNNDIFDVNEIRGRDPLQADPDHLRINVTNNGAVTVGDGAVTIGNGDLTVGNGNTNFGTGTFTKGTGLSTFNGDVVMNEDVTLGSADDDDIAANGEFTTNLVPNTSGANTLGTDAKRWGSAYLSGASAHIGDNDGEANFDEMAIRYNGSNQGSFAVGDGVANTNAQFTINGGGDALTMDPAADAGQNYTFTEGSLTVNTAGTADLIITEVGMNRNGGANETFTFANTGGDLDVTIDGSLDVDENVILGTAGTNTIAANGDFTTNLVPDASTETIGTDAQRWADVYVLGNSVHVGPNGGLAANTEMNIGYASNAGTINVDAATNNQLTVDADNDLVTVNASDDAIAELTIDPTDAAVGFVVNSNSTTGAEITSNASGILLDVDGDGTNNFNATGALINMDADDDGTNDIVMDPAGTGFTVNANSAGNNEITANGSVINLDVDGDATNNFNATGTLINLNANDDGVNDVVIDPSNAAVGFTVNSNSVGGNEITSNASGINLDVDGDGTNNFNATGAVINLDANDDGTAEYNSNGTTMNLNANSDGNNDVVISTAGVVIDANSDATANYTLTNTEATINTGGGVDMVVTEGTIERNDAADQTLTLQNTNATGELNVSIEGDVVLGTASANTIAANGEFTTNLVPQNASAPITVGTDANRWADVYVTGTSVHVGPNGGEAGSTELNIGYASNAGTINVDGATNNQLTVDAANDRVTINASDDVNAEITVDANGILLDSDSDGVANIDLNPLYMRVDINDDGNADIVANSSVITLDGNSDGNYEFQTNGTTIELNPGSDNSGANNYIFAETSLTIDNDNGGAGVDAIITESGLNRNNAATQTFTFANTGAGNLDVNIQGDLDVDVDLNTDGNTTLNANVDLGDTDADDINVPGEFISNLVPNTDNSNDLGSDAKRWANVYVNGASVHVGDADGQANFDEMAIRYNGSNQGSLAVGDGAANTNSQLTINAAGDVVTFDPNADATQNLSVASTGITLSNGGTSDVTISDAGVTVSNAGAQTFAFTNTDGANDLDVTIDGDVVLGAAVGNDLAVNGRLTTDLIPRVDNSVDLGNITDTWGTAFIGTEVQFRETADATDYVGLQAPGDVTASVTYTLPAAGPSTNGLALISTTGGVMSWGGITLQNAYEAGNTITTDGPNGDVIFTGSQEFDLRIDLKNTFGVNPVTIDDPHGLNVISGGLITGNGGLSITAGASTLSGGLTVTGALTTLSNGLAVTGNDITLSGTGNFTMSSTGNFTVSNNVATTSITSSDVTINTGSTGGNTTTINGDDIDLGNTNLAARLTVSTPISHSTGTGIGDYRSVLIISDASAGNYTAADLNANFTDGAIVHIYNTGAAVARTITLSGKTVDLNEDDGVVIARSGGSWYIIGESN